MRGAKQAVLYIGVWHPFFYEKGDGNGKEKEKTGEQIPDDDDGIWIHTCRIGNCRDYI